MGLKHRLKATFVGEWIQRRREAVAIRQWEVAGRPVPCPPAVKRRIVGNYAKRFGPRVFIETGTFLGDMVHAMRNRFDKLYSIELSSELALRACERFKKRSHITILQGDSEKVLPELMQSIHEPCLFWLDGHWSDGLTAHADKDTPIIAESETILRGQPRNHVVLIDDARCFVGKNDYPTIEELRRLYLGARPDFRFEVAEDIIRITPRETGGERSRP